MADSGHRRMADPGDDAAGANGLAVGMTITDNTITETPTGPSRGEQLAERIIAGATLGTELLTIDIGRRLGLYEVLFRLGPTVVSEFAAAAGIAPRYAREWLEQQAAAGILDVVTPGVPQTREYLLPGAHVPVLLDAVHPLNVIGASAMFSGFSLAVPAVAEAFQTGGGVPYSDYGAEVRDGIAQLNRPSFHHGMKSWIQALPDVAARLDYGAVVLDAGCGAGWSTIALALAFPAARIVGADTDSASIRLARGNAADAGVSDRVTFIEVNASDESTIRSPFEEDYALVTVFEALHDMGEPVKALAAFRGVLAEGGVVLVADERVADEFTAPATEIDRLQYAVSVLHCLPATMAESDAVASGTVLRAPTVMSWADSAGFASTVRLPIEHLYWQFYRMV